MGDKQMKYLGMSAGMWMLFSGSFQKQFVETLGHDPAAARQIAKKAKPRYQAIIADLPEFEKDDRFQVKVLNCALLGVFALSCPERPKVEPLTDY